MALREAGAAATTDTEICRISNLSLLWFLVRCGGTAPTTAPFGTCTVDWPLLDEREDELSRGVLPS
jgi:hypothetical protein